MAGQPLDSPKVTVTFATSMPELWLVCRRRLSSSVAVKLHPVVGSDSGNQLPRRAETQMADPIARRPRIRQSPGEVALKFAARLILPTIITGMMAAPIATAGTPRIVPLGCGVTWTRVGGAFIASPGVCPQQPPASQPPPDGPASDPGPPPTP